MNLEWKGADSALPFTLFYFIYFSDLWEEIISVLTSRFNMSVPRHVHGDKKLMMFHDHSILNWMEDRSFESLPTGCSCIHIFFFKVAYNNCIRVQPYIWKWLIGQGNQLTTPVFFCVPKFQDSPYMFCFLSLMENLVPKLSKHCPNIRLFFLGLID